MRNSKNGKKCVTLQSFSAATILIDNRKTERMKLPKNMNTFPFANIPFNKVVFQMVFFLLITSSIFAQNPAPAPVAPTADPNAAPTNQPAVTPTQTQKNTTQPNNTNQPKTQPRTRTIPATNGTPVRTIQGLDENAMTHEDSIAAVKKAEADDDLLTTAYRKRIFGYNLFNKTKFEFAPQLNIATPNNYILGPNDELIIDIYGYSQATYNSKISADGFITIKGIGVIYVAGTTIEDAKSKIVDRLSKIYVGLKPNGGYAPNTFCNVSLGNIRSIKVTVTGEAITPGTYTLPSLASAMNVLYLCGGPNEIGSYRKIEIIRQNKVAATLDLYDILTKGVSEGNILLQDQDIVQIKPYISRVALSGLIKRNGLFELKNNEKLEQLIFYAGGFRPDAYTHRLKIYRNTAREKKIIDVQQENFGTFEMLSGDSVEVERVLKRFENLVTIKGAVFRPGEYSLSENTTLLSLINSSEGLKGEALLGRISIFRTNENMSVENIAVSLDDIQKGKSPDVVLKREDVVTIPSMFDLTEPSFIRISGAINNPDAEVGIELPFVKNMTIEDVLVKIGGITEAASLSRVEIVRRKRNADISSASAQISESYYFNIRPDLRIEDAGAKFVLFPYDEIFIRKSPNYQKQTFAEVQGEVFYPAIYGIRSKDEKISEIVQRAGGLTPQSYLEGATLIRKVQLSETEIAQRRRAVTDIANSQRGNQQVQVEDVDQTKSESIGINLAKILENPGAVEDMVLQDGDIVRIPKRLETVRIQGEVLYPTTTKFSNGANFIYYISHSGGFTKRSLRSKAYVLYANGSVDRTRRFLFVNIYPKIAPGSEIIIPQKTATTQQQLAQINTLFTTVAGTISTLLSIYTIFRLTKQ